MRRKALEHDKASVVPPSWYSSSSSSSASSHSLYPSPPPPPLSSILFPCLVQGGGGRGKVVVAVVYARASVCVPFLLLFYSVDPSMSRPNKAVQCMGEYHCTVGSGGCSPLFSPEPSESEAEATTGGGREAAACHTSGSSYTSLLPPLSYQQAEEGRERGVGGQGKTQEGRGGCNGATWDGWMAMAISSSSSVRRRRRPPPSLPSFLLPYTNTNEKKRPLFLPPRRRRRRGAGKEGGCGYKGQPLPSLSLPQPQTPFSFPLFLLLLFSPPIATLPKHCLLSYASLPLLFPRRRRLRTQLPSSSSSSCFPPSSPSAPPPSFRIVYEKPLPSLRP